MYEKEIFYSTGAERCLAPTENEFKQIECFSFIWSSIKVVTHTMKCTVPCPNYQDYKQSRNHLHLQKQV